MSVDLLDLVVLGWMVAMSDNENMVMTSDRDSSTAKKLYLWG